MAWNLRGFVGYLETDLLKAGGKFGVRRKVRKRLIADALKQEKTPFEEEETCVYLCVCFRC